MSAREPLPVSALIDCLDDRVLAALSTADGEQRTEVLEPLLEMFE